LLISAIEAHETLREIGVAQSYLSDRLKFEPAVRVRLDARSQKRVAHGEASGRSNRPRDRAELLEDR
jgi:hypothetical protein